MTQAWAFKAGLYYIPPYLIITSSKVIMGFQLWLKVLEILIVRILELIGHLALKEMLGGLDPPVWTAHLKEFNIDNIIQEQCHLLHKNNSATRHLRGKLIRRFRSGQDKLLALSPSQAPALIHFWCELLMKESGPDGVSTAKQQKNTKDGIKAIFWLVNVGGYSEQTSKFDV